MDYTLHQYTSLLTQISPVFLALFVTFYGKFYKKSELLFVLIRFCTLSHYNVQTKRCISVLQSVSGWKVTTKDSAILFNTHKKGKTCYFFDVAPAEYLEFPSKYLILGGT